MKVLFTHQVGRMANIKRVVFRRRFNRVDLVTNPETLFGIKNGQLNFFSLKEKLESADDAVLMDIPLDIVKRKRMERLLNEMRFKTVLDRSWIDANFSEMGDWIYGPEMTSSEVVAYLFHQAGRRIVDQNNTKAIDPGQLFELPFFKETITL